MKNSKNVWSVVSLAAIVASSWSMPAVAVPAEQPAAPAADEARAANPAGFEIVVTAQRRSERLIDVPLSVSVVSGEQLKSSGITRMDELSRAVPNLSISRNGAYPQPAIRGITTRAAGPGAEANVATYVDGFYMPEPLLLNMDFANVSNVQVLKGPQGTLYGRNATGGALLITTYEPDLSRPIIDLEAGLGSRDDRRLRGYVAAPLIGDKLAIGVGGYYRRNDGYVKKLDGSNAAPVDLREIRAKLKAQPTENLGIVLAYNYDYVNDARAVVYNATDVYLGGLPIPPGSFTSQRDVASQGPDPSGYIVRLREGTARVEWETPIGTLTSRTSVGKSKLDIHQDQDHTLVDFLRVVSLIDRKYVTESLDYNKDVTSNLTLLAGGLYYWDRNGFRADSFVRGAFFQTNLATLRTRSFAVYADATLKIGERLFLTVGGRQSWEHKSNESTTVRGGVSMVIAPVGTDRTFKDFTPRAAVRYEISPDSSVYATFSKGFKTGTFNPAAATTATAILPIRPEKVTAYEVGYKLAQGPLRFETAAFYYDYKDLQVTSIQTIAGGISAIITTNAATARSYGFEGSLNYNLMHDLNLRLGVGYTHARYRNYPASPATLLVSGHNVAGFLQDLSGQRLANAPDWNVSGGVDYTAHVGENAVKFTLGGSYTTKYAPTNETYDPATGKPRFYQGGFFIASAGIDWTLPGDHISVGAYANNFTNKRYKIQYTANAQGSYSVYNEPRAFGVRVGYKY